MVLADYEEVYRLWSSCPEMELNDIDDSESGVARFLARNPDTSFVAEVDGKVAGVLLVGCDGRRGYIYHAGVLPAYRGQGIGTALINETQQALKEIGITKAGLLVFANNERGKRFWIHHGFEVREDLVYQSCVLHR